MGWSGISGAAVAALGLSVSAAQGADPVTCAREQNVFATRARVSSLSVGPAVCTRDGTRLYSLRTFSKNSVPFRLLVDTATLKTSVVPASCLENCQALPLEKWPRSRYLDGVAAGTAPPYPLANDGITHADHPLPGYFLTMDLCPSRKVPGLDHEIFDFLGRWSEGGAVPIGLAVSGLWLERHDRELQWLQAEAQAKRLEITWVNHSYSHPYRHNLPDARNFLLTAGVDLEMEINETERVMLVRGLTPSVFFRFPGLISNPRTIEALRVHGLIPLGADAWLAKGETPHDGSVILVHANQNEEPGLALLEELLAKLPPTFELHALPELFAPE